jgi:hypothetical protein
MLKYAGKTLVVGVLLCTALVADEAEKCRPTPRPVGDIINMPAKCTRNSLAAGLPIHGVYPQVHCGSIIEFYYQNGKIMTHLAGGVQWVELQDPDRCGDMQSKSYSAVTEEIGGVQWLVFYHDGFRVYSRNDQQFVIAQ